VRAVVLPLLDHEAALQLHSAVRHALQLLLAEDSVWYQDETVMHATLYHASTHGVSATWSDRLDVDVIRTSAANLLCCSSFTRVELSMQGDMHCKHSLLLQHRPHMRSNQGAIET
jgi:hypothetical protein